MSEQEKGTIKHYVTYSEDNVPTVSDETAQKSANNEMVWFNFMAAVGLVLALLGFITVISK